MKGAQWDNERRLAEVTSVIPPSHAYRLYLQRMSSVV